LEVIFLLINYGRDFDRVLRLTSEGINGLRNDTIREAPFENMEILEPRHQIALAGGPVGGRD
jgi:hypothetical protein